MHAETGGQYCIMSSFHLWDSFQRSVRPLGLRALSLPYLLDWPFSVAVIKDHNQKQLTEEGLYYDCVLDRVHKGGEIWLQVPRAGSQETTSPITFGRQNDEIGIWTRL